MGTDIHLRVQRRERHSCKFCGLPSNVDPSDQTMPSDYCHEADHGEPVWVAVSNSEVFGPGPIRVWLDAFDAVRKTFGKTMTSELTAEENRACRDAAKLAQESLIDGDPTERNYLLFARLADVRNGYGVAGLESHRKVEPLFANRGLPEDDIDRDPTEGWTDEEVDQLYVGDHSFTHATLAELLRTVDEDTPPTGRLDMAVRLTGVVDIAAYERWLETGAPPEDYSLDIAGPGIVTYDHDALAVLAPPAETALELARRDVEEGRVTRPHFRIRWNACPMRDCGFARWLRGPRVRALVDNYGAGDVRVLIGFDS